MWLFVIYVVFGLLIGAIARMDGRSWPVSILFGLFWPVFLRAGIEWIWKPSGRKKAR